MQRKQIALAVALAAVLGFVAALFAPAPAEAIPACGYHQLYYSDGSHTQLVGERWVTVKSCGCQFQGWGQVTGYRVSGDPICGIL